MSGDTETVFVPRWNLADRLGKAMREAEFTVADMANYLGVHRNTISGYLHGRIKPDTRTLRLWAAATRVPYEWLRYGDHMLPRLDSNQEPFGYRCVA